MSDHSTNPPSRGNSGSDRYEVIARRYRPRNFDEVVGQEAVAEVLRQAILQNRLAHAYLFCGPRGVGKTSMARIFARTLQCPEGDGALPCDRCATCEQIFRGEDSDVTEMDGASHRGIDDIRSLIEHVQYAPTQGPYRIFIIDEVHMLTREAFNSLLKTLEEPPAHVKFIFATTEPERIIPTVLSRCQRCDFSSISRGDIVRRLGQICELEGAAPREGLLENIASLSAGGMRDAQSLLDQVLSFAGEEPGPDDLDRITGRISEEKLDQLLAAAESAEMAAVVAQLTPIFEGGTEASVLTEQIAEALRHRLHEGVKRNWSGDELERNLLAQEIIQETRQKLRRQDRGDLLLELALMRISTLRSLVPIDTLVKGSPSPLIGETGGVVEGTGSSVDTTPRTPKAQETADTPPVVTRAPEVAAAGGAQAARERLRQGTKDSPPVAESTSRSTPSRGDESASPEQELLDCLKAIDAMLPRKFQVGGRLERSAAGWSLQARSSLFDALSSEGANKAFRSWEKKNGSLIIERWSEQEEAEKPVLGASTSGERPEIVGQAEEIFSSEARNRGPRSDGDPIPG